MRIFLVLLASLVALLVPLVSAGWRLWGLGDLVHRRAGRAGGRLAASGELAAACRDRLNAACAGIMPLSARRATRVPSLGDLIV